MNNEISTPLNVPGAMAARDSMAQTIYSALFRWLVSKVNTRLQVTLLFMCDV